MKINIAPSTLLALISWAVLGAPARVQATLISISATAPTVDEADIANFDLTTVIDDFQTSVIWGDRPARGQTFLTAATAAGYSLDAITFQAANDQNDNGTYFIRVGAVTGTTFTQIGAESVTTTDNVAANDYVTFTLDTPLPLLPATTYGFDIGRSGSGWRLLNNAQTEYPDGSAYTSGAGGMGGLTLSNNNQDRIFHLNLTAIPEPSSLLLFSLGALGLATHRRRK